MGLFDLFLNYPVNVIIWKKYKNNLIPEFDKGRFFLQKLNTDYGVIQKEFFKLKKMNVKIPAFDVRHYYKDEKNITIHLLQVERNLFLPLKFTDTQIVYLDNEPELDENGNVKRDDKGNPIFKKVEKILLDTNFVFDPDEKKFIPLSVFVPEKVYDKEYWLSSEIEMANKHYSIKNFWTKYGAIIIMFIAVFGMIAVSFFALKRMGEIAGMFMESERQIANSLDKVADKLGNVIEKLNQTNQELPQLPPPV